MILVLARAEDQTAEAVIVAVAPNARPIQEVAALQTQEAAAPLMQEVPVEVAIQAPEVAHKRPVYLPCSTFPMIQTQRPN